MSMTISDGVTSWTFKLKDLAEVETTKSKEIPIPGSDPVLVPLGKLGPLFNLTTMVDETGYLTQKAIDLGSIVTVSATTYPEFTVSEEYHFNKRKPVRKAGMINRWLISFSLLRSW